MNKAKMELSQSPIQKLYSVAASMGIATITSLIRYIPKTFRIILKRVLADIFLQLW
jgi:hypothetical protein